MRIFNEATGTDRHFQKKEYACNKMDILQLLKIRVDFSILPCGIADDTVNESPSIYLVTAELYLPRLSTQL